MRCYRFDPFRYTLTHDEVVKLRGINYTRLKQRGEKLQNPIRSDSRMSERSSSSHLKIKNLSSKQKLKVSKRSSVSSKKSMNSKQSINTENDTPLRDTIMMDEVSNYPFSGESRPIKGEMMAIGNFELQHFNLSCKPSIFNFGK